MQEFDFISSLRRMMAASAMVPVGIGDDAAMVLCRRPEGLLVTTDMLMEGTDFTFPPATPELAGRKALAVNLSDIAAMAGRPVAAFVSLALPKSRGSDFAVRFSSGLQHLADQFSVTVAGGDTNSWDGPFVVNVALLGEPTGRGPVLRSTASPGDWIFVTGAFGGSIHGRHLAFAPRIEEAIALHASVRLTSMIDVSDGLSADLHHILEESGVGGVIDAATIPIHADAVATPLQSPLERALGDGEDFELIFTVSEGDGRKLIHDSPIATPVTCIGRITEQKGAWIDTAEGRVPLARVGWEHRLS